MKKKKEYQTNYDALQKKFKKINENIQSIIFSKWILTNKFQFSSFTFSFISRNCKIIELFRVCFFAGISINRVLERSSKQWLKKNVTKLPHIN